ncbi:PREDICTED: uncharacterized protein LOC109476302 [Branchiostoma belcheri]|uniref:Uncharacterized protein LOC109476302 n=1 Tax=Branchiostoma belcheri TaxID=7741 RepID=A0A6P4YTM5_BRABE|nr:PREDICTED: uncharacterized protein LOC109476302 [Branchiostoma belcheri]
MKVVPAPSGATMNPRHKEILTANLPLLCQDLTVKYVLPDLVEEGVLLPAMKEDIMAEPTKEDQVALLVRLLQTMGPKAFHGFTTVLEKHYQHLATILRQYNADVQLFFNFVAKKVGRKWKDLARQLGFMEANIEEIDDLPRLHDHTDRCREVLKRWHQEKGHDATLGVLTEALQNAELKNVSDDLMEVLMLTNTGHQDSTQKQQSKDDTCLLSRSLEGEAVWMQDRERAETLEKDSAFSEGTNLLSAQPSSASLPIVFENEDKGCVKEGQQSPKKPISPVKDTTWYSSLFSWTQKSGRQLTPRELYHLCRTLNPYWERVGCQLGLDQDTLDRCALDNRDSPWGQVHDMLLTWMEQSGVEATVEKLTDVLQHGLVGLRIDLYWFLVVPSDWELGYLAWKLEKDPAWEQAATQLGLTQEQITHAQSYYPDNKPAQIHYLLLKWKKRCGDEATLDRLCEALRSQKVAEDVFVFLTDPDSQVVTAWYLAQLAPSLTSYWKQLVTELGMSEEESEGCKNRYPNCPTKQVLAALLKWKGMPEYQSAAASVRNLCLALNRTGVKLDISLLNPSAPVVTVWQLGTLAGKLNIMASEPVCQVHLGLSREDVQTCREGSGGDEHLHNMAMLLRWLEMAGSQATLDKLCEGLLQEFVDEDNFIFMLVPEVPRQPTGKELFQLAVKLQTDPSKLTRLPIRLGFTHDDDQHWQLDITSGRNATHAMLQEWKKRVGAEATVVKLSEALQQEGVGPDKYLHLCFEEGNGFLEYSL